VQDSCNKGDLCGSSRAISFEKPKSTKAKHTSIKSPINKRKQKTQDIGPTPKPVQKIQINPHPNY